MPQRIETYVNHIMREKSNFKTMLAVEVSVEVVETLQIHGFAEVGIWGEKELPRILCGAGCQK